MKGKVYIFTMTENIWKAVAGLSHLKNNIIKEMKRKEYIGTEAIQKVEVCLDHDGKRKHIKMKRKAEISESTRAIQTSGVGLDHKY